MTTTNSVGGICQHLECIHRIRLERGMKNQKPGKFELTFDFIPIQLLDLMVLSGGHPKNVVLIRALSIEIDSYSFIPSASTRLPRRVYHLYVSS